MFLSAQSMAIGTVMVRWVSKYSDPIMATGWVCYPQMNNQSILFLSLCHMRQSSAMLLILLLQVSHFVVYFANNFTCYGIANSYSAECNVYSICCYNRKLIAYSCSSKSITI